MINYNKKPIAKRTPLKQKTPLKKTSSLKTYTPLKSNTELKQYTPLKSSNKPIKVHQHSAKKLKTEYFSIFGPLDICVITGSKKNVVPHHIYEGPYKKASEKYGFILPIRKDYHTGYPYSIHENTTLQIKYKIICQYYYVTVLNKTKDSFIEEFGKWY